MKEVDHPCCLAPTFEKMFARTTHEQEKCSSFRLLFSKNVLFVHVSLSMLFSFFSTAYALQPALPLFGYKDVSNIRIFEYLLVDFAFEYAEYSNIRHFAILNFYALSALRASNSSFTHS